MKWIRGMSCRCQSVKLSVWSSRLLMCCIKKKQSKSQVISLSYNTKNSNFSAEILYY